jgi:hypothetical protein
MKILDGLRRRFSKLDEVNARLERVQEALGRIEGRQLSDADAPALAASEFRVFSQWGEDGIIQRLVREVAVSPRIFVEFGVQDYSEANTRYLLTNDNWAGLVIDGSPENIARVKADPIYWRHNLKATCAFVTRENINELLASAGLGGEIGLLSVDIDGNDYWVWEAITAVDAVLVVAEYNWRFGAERRVTVPYRADFVRDTAHHSMVYYGASLAALEALGRRKGYDLVGCNSAGNNAFFVRADRRPASLPVVGAAEAFVAGRFREARGIDGSFADLAPEAEKTLVESLPVVEVPPGT